MKRKIASIILAACMAMPCMVSLAACGGGMKIPHTPTSGK